MIHLHTSNNISSCKIMWHPYIISMQYNVLSQYYENSLYCITALWSWNIMWHPYLLAMQYFVAPLYFIHAILFGIPTLWSCNIMWHPCTCHLFDVPSLSGFSLETSIINCLIEINSLLHINLTRFSTLILHVSLH